MSQISDNARITLTVNGQQVKKEMADLTQKIEQATKAIDEMYNRFEDPNKIKKAERELAQYKKRLAELEAATKGVEDALQNLDKATPRQLQDALKTLNRQMKDMSPSSAGWDEHIEKIRMLKERLQELRGEADVQQSAWEKFKNFINDNGAALLAIGLAADETIDYLRGFVDEFSKMDAEMANVRKFTGMSEAQVEKLNEAFKNMDTRTSREALNGLAQDAGRLGKQSVEDVLGFVRGADKVNVALDDLGSNAALSISKLTGIFGDEEKYGTEKALLKVGSVINELSQNCSASAPYLANFAERMGGVGAQAKMTIPQIIGIGAVLDSNSQKVEASATAVSQVLVRMMQDPAKYAKTAGMDVQKFADLLRTDANEAFLQFLEHLKKAGGMDVLSPMFKDMGENGSRAISALSTLADKIESVRLQQQEAKTAFDQGSSIDKEFAVQNNTVEASLEKCAKAAKELHVELGKNLYPIMRYFLKSSTALVKVISAVVSFMLNNTRAAISLASTIIALTVAIKAKSVAQFLSNTYEKTAAALKWLHAAAVKALAVAHDGLGGNIKKATIAFKAFDMSMKVTVIGAVIAAVASLATALYGLYKKIRESDVAMAEFKASLTDLRTLTADFSKKELALLDNLYLAMTNDYLAREKRLKAAERLQKLYPDIFGALTTEEMLVGKAAKSYDSLRTSILQAANARAAQKKFEQNAEERFEYDNELSRLKEVLQYQLGQRAKVQQQIDLATQELKDAYAGSELSRRRKARSRLSDLKDDLMEWDNIIRNRQNLIDAYEKKVGYYNKAQNYLIERYKIDVSASWMEQEPDQENDDSDEEDEETSTRLESEAERKKRLKEERAKAIQARKQFRKEIDALKAEYMAAVKVEEVNHADGVTEWREFLKNKLDLEVKFYDDQAKVFEKFGIADCADYEKVLKKKEEILIAWNENNRKLSAEELKRQQKQEEDELSRQFYTPGYAMFQQEEARQLRLHEIRVKYLRLTRDLYEIGSQQWHDYELQLTDVETADKLRKQQNLAKKYKEWHEKFEKLSAQDRLDQELRMLTVLYQQKMLSESKYQKWRRLIEQKYEKELSGKNSLVVTDDSGKTHSLDTRSDFEQTRAKYEELDRMRKKFQSEAESLHLQGVTSEDEYRRQLLAIDKQYFEEVSKLLGAALDPATAKILNLAKVWLNAWKSMKEGGKDALKDIANATAATFAAMGAIMETYSQFSQAQYQIQQTAVEKKYDAEIEAAQGNSYRVAALEKQKAEELERIRRESTEKDFALKVISAVATTAQNAILAYAAGLQLPTPANIFMPPVLAGMAAAQGAVQIALIKKQRDAALAQGYADGGFTGAGGKYEPAGIVHKGEWVASQKLLASPVTRPIIEALDFAQRNNTMARLRPEAVAGSVSHGRTGSRESEAVSPAIMAALERSSSVIARLERRLDEPIVAETYVTGRRGVRTSLDEYSRMINNVTPKSRRKP